MARALPLTSVHMIVFIRILVLCLLPGFHLSQLQVESSATIIFAGDVNFARHFELIADPKLMNVFARWGKICKYDVMMVNLENAVTRSVDSVEKEFVFKMKPEYLSQFNRARISIVNCANNHTADFGAEGILETIRQLDSAGIRHVGIGRNLAEARKPVILKTNGIRIGFLGYGGEKKYIASDTLPGTTAPSRAIIVADLKRLKPKVDFIVVHLHWGDELAVPTR